MADEHLPEDYFVAGDDGDDLVADGADQRTASAEKKPKKKKNGKKVGPERVDLASLDAKAAALHLTESYCKAHPRISSLERNDISLSEGAFLKATKERTITSYISTLPDLSSIYKSPKCRIVVFCSSALRCIEVLKLLSQQVKGKCTVGKLFAKHIKASDQIAMLKKSSIPIVVGTPGRISAIMESEPSLFAETSVLIIDAKRDVKLRTVLDMKEISDPLHSIIFSKFIRQLKSSTAKLALAE